MTCDESEVSAKAKLNGVAGENNKQNADTNSAVDVDIESATEQEKFLVAMMNLSGRKNVVWVD